MGGGGEGAIGGSGGQDLRCPGPIGPGAGATGSTIGSMYFVQGASATLKATRSASSSATTTAIDRSELNMPLAKADCEIEQQSSSNRTVYDLLAVSTWTTSLIKAKRVGLSNSYV